MTDERAWASVVLADGEAPAPPRDRARETVHRILAGSLGALLVLVVTGYLVGARIADSQALADARELTEVVGEAVVGPNLTSQVVDGERGALRQLDHVVSDRLLRRTLIRRVKIWSSDGVVLYSNEPAEIGTSFHLDEEQRSALATGKPVASVSDLSDAENVSDQALGSRMVEVYTTLRSLDGRPVLFEAYLSYDEVQSRRVSVFTMLSILAASLLGLFALFQVWLSAVNLRWLRQRQGELKVAAEAASSRERASVARDLHDGVVQELVGTTYLVEGARASLGARDLAHADMLLVRTADCVRSSIQALRSTLIVVYPPTLGEDGLGQALEDLAQPLRARGIAVTVDDAIEGHLPRQAVQVTYRVAREALRNVARHAHASTVTIRVHVDRGHLCLVVRDDGVGLDPGFGSGSCSPRGHFGLRTLADDAREVQAHLELRSAPDRGTELRWEVPL